MHHRSLVVPQAQPVGGVCYKDLRGGDREAGVTVARGVGRVRAGH